MALQRGKLADIQTLAAAAASIYTNPASARTYVRGLVIHNTNSSAELVTLYNVPASGGAAGAAAATNQFLNVSLSASETASFSLAYPFVLDAIGDSLQGKSTTAGKVTIQIMGDKDV